MEELLSYKSFLHIILESISRILFIILLLFLINVQENKEFINIQYSTHTRQNSQRKKNIRQKNLRVIRQEMKKNR